MRRTPDMDAIRPAAIGWAVAVVLTVSACAGSGPGSSAETVPTSTATSSDSGSPAGGSLLRDRQPLNLLAGLPGQGQVRVLQGAARAPDGATVALLTVPGIGTLRARCSAAPTTSFGLTAWARGEGPPLVQHVHAMLRHRVSLPPLNELHMPVLPVGSGAAPEAFDQWQVAIATEAFSATGTVWSVALRAGRRCEMAAEGVVVSHGQFYRYAPGHG
jgi:hypothetical protein